MFDAKYKQAYLTQDVFERIDHFWEWFQLQHLEIEKLIREQNKIILNTFEKELGKVFNEYRKIVPFALGISDNKYKMYIYFGHNSYILTVGDELYNRMPKNLKQNWVLYIEK